MAASKPIVACVRGETAAILEQAGALLLPPEDPKALAGALEELVNDGDRRGRIGRQASAFVRKQYDRSRLAATYRELLHEVVGLPS